MLGDAGSAIISEDFHAIHMNNWNPQAKFPDWIPGFERPFTEYNVDEMYKMTADYYPHSKVAQYTTAWDWTQTFIYKVMLNILDPIQSENWPSV
jgi:hypothetical protein